MFQSPFVPLMDYKLLCIGMQAINILALNGNINWASTTIGFGLLSNLMKACTTLWWLCYTILVYNILYCI